MAFENESVLCNLEAERSVLGSMLLDWKCAGDVVQKLKAGDFYDLRNQVIYASLVRLYQKGVQGDIVTLTEDLEAAEKSQESGGTQYLLELSDEVPTAVNVMRYVDVVLDRSIRRQLVSAAQEIKADSFEIGKKSPELLEAAEKRIFALTDTMQTAQILTMHDVMTMTIEAIDARYKGGFLGVSSGVSDLDVMTSGFQKGEMIVIGARPSMGKTALALTMMQNIAIENGVSCGFFSLEMSAIQIGQRLLVQVARVPSTKVRSGMLKIEDFKRIQDAAEVCNVAPFYIVDSPNLRILDLKVLARRMKVKYDVKIIFIDYIGLITSEMPKAPMYEQQSAISKELKSLARELEIPIVVLCQLNRDAEGAEPNLAQLRGSGSIEQDADTVMFIHGDRATEDDDGGYASVQERKLIVAKQRNGPIGDIDVLFLSKYTKFENKAGVSDGA